MADLSLADAVDAAEALLQAVGVPGEVVVDHQVRALEVYALAGGVVGDHEEDIRVLGEGYDCLTAFIASETAVDHDDLLVLAAQRPDLLGQVEERILRLGEDDQLPAVTVFVGH